ncbi:MAG: cobyrinate a,c-diamide synthase [Pseudomonadota bacterium]
MVSVTDRPRGLVIAAPSSGAGKTVVALGLMRALREAGHRVAGAKSGPDYIDPRFHEAATGSPSVNLDAWAMDGGSLRARAAVPADLLVVEGAMGALDGAPPEGRGSGADLATALALPLVLVIDAARQAQSVALPLAGLAALRPDVQIAGAILNRVASERHARAARAAVERAGHVVLGVIPREAALALPSRHLGLVQAGEHPDLERFVARAAEIVAAGTDLDRLAALAAPVAPVGEETAPRRLSPLGQRIAIASDEAFAFAYPHLLTDWQAAGATLHPFSPLADEAPDAEADAIFLPGGYPELHAGRLAAATGLAAGIQAAAARGARIYGECGGYMVLGQGLIDAEGVRHAMLGLLPVTTSFAARRMTLGYRTLIPRRGAPVTGRHAGHEFHFASILDEGPGEAVFDATDAEGAPLTPMGRQVGTVAGSFAHLIAPCP